MSEGQRKARAEQRWMMCFAILLMFFGWLNGDIEEGAMLAWPLVVASGVISAMRHLHRDIHP